MNNQLRVTLATSPRDGTLSVGAGLTTAIPPAPLERGSEYMIHLLGLATGALRFRVDDTGTVRPL